MVVALFLKQSRELRENVRFSLLRLMVMGVLTVALVMRGLSPRLLPPDRPSKVLEALLLEDAQ